jgi:hypothetical protein
MTKMTAEKTVTTLPIQEFYDVLDTNPSCLGVVVGYMAERVLANKLKENEEFISIEKISDHDTRKGDLLVTHGEKTFSIEVKCAASHMMRENFLEGGHEIAVRTKLSDLATLPDGTRTSCPERGQYDILAICIGTVTGDWDFLFMHNKHIPVASKFPNRIKAQIRVNTENTPCLYKDIHQVLDNLS